MSRLWKRELDHYPEMNIRMLQVGIVVLGSIILDCEAYAPGAVSPLILTHYHMSFSYYLYAQVIFGIIGAFSALVGRWADRVGRANVTVLGVGFVGIMQLAVVPAMPSKLSFVFAVGAEGFAEGAALVTTAALVRDFTPQLRRGLAIGFWTLGPVVGSLIVSLVANHTLSTWHSWESQFYITGIAGCVMFLIMMFTLRELNAPLRSQLMVSERDQALVEARARGRAEGADVDVEVAPSHPWKRVLRADIVLPAVGISCFLIVYYAAVLFFPIFLTTVFRSGNGGFLTTTQANGIDTWFWAFDAGVLIAVGWLSDKLRVRKPFMIVGGIGAIGGTVALLIATSHPHTGYYGIVVITVIIAVFLAVGYAPWMAAFTETAEAHHPALVATALAVFGVSARLVIALSGLFVPIVVNTVTPIIDNAPAAAQAQAIAAKNPQAVAIVTAHPQLFAQLQQYSNPADIPPNLLKQAVQEVGPQGLATVSAAGPALKQLAALEPKINKLEKNIKNNPSRWQRWWWVCIGGEVVFLLLTPITRGRWSPRKAKEDADVHEKLVEEELAKLGITAPTA